MVSYLSYEENPVEKIQWLLTYVPKEVSSYEFFDRLCENVFRSNEKKEILKAKEIIDNHHKPFPKQFLNSDLYSISGDFFCIYFVTLNSVRSVYFSECIEK